MTDSSTSWRNVCAIHAMIPFPTRLERRPQPDQRKDAEHIGTPHRSDQIGEEDGNFGVDAVGPQDLTSQPTDADCLIDDVMGLYGAVYPAIAHPALLDRRTSSMAPTNR